MSETNSTNQMFVDSLPERQRSDSWVHEAATHETFNEKDYWAEEDRDREERSK